MEINRKNFGGLVLVMAYLTLIRGVFDHWGGYILALFLCIIAVLLLKDKGERWFENKWFKGYVSVHFLLFIMYLFGFANELKLGWFVPKDALYVRLYHSNYTDLPTFFTYFLTWVFFTGCLFSDKKHWFRRWQLFIWTSLIFIGWNIAMLNHYQYVDEDAIHSKGVFSSTTLPIDQVWMLKVDPKRQTIVARYGRVEEYVNYDMYFTSLEGTSITMKDMKVIEKDIHAAAMIIQQLEDDDRERKAIIVRDFFFMSPKMTEILDRHLNQLDDDAEALFIETVMGR
ncbi:hypothetical protein GJU40_03670 [Bacillus lacus]|uniref:Uncharacterized protein n=1 Tax=Metabacillus lacus TaxID=1983721 RepID=A0A7X2LXG7_9BACI|nr:hypothetical protein [Metabacillus lacus]MRX71271.1 hypothetical protein [Metabacillus lacus]